MRRFITSLTFMALVASTSAFGSEEYASLLPQPPLSEDCGHDIYLLYEDLAFDARDEYETRLSIALRLYQNTGEDFRTAIRKTAFTAYKNVATREYEKCVWHMRNFCPESIAAIQ